MLPIQIVPRLRYLQNRILLRGEIHSQQQQTGSLGAAHRYIFIRKT